MSWIFLLAKYSNVIPKNNNIRLELQPPWQNLIPLFWNKMPLWLPWKIASFPPNVLWAAQWLLCYGAEVMTVWGEIEWLTTERKACGPRTPAKSHTKPHLFLRLCRSVISKPERQGDDFSLLFCNSWHPLHLGTIGFHPEDASIEETVSVSTLAGLGVLDG